MEGLGRLSLLVQAQAEGVIDCREAQPEEPHWWLRAKFLLDAVHRKNEREQCAVTIAQLNAELARFPFGLGGKEYVQHIHQASNRLTSTLHRLYNPWLQEPAEASDEQNVAKVGKSLWEAEFGEMDEARIEAAAAELMQLGNRTKERQQRLDKIAPGLSANPSMEGYLRMNRRAR